jgi:hypothetical protein
MVINRWYIFIVILQKKENFENNNSIMVLGDKHIKFFV